MSHDGKADTKTMPAPEICTAAHAVGHEIDLSFGESQRDMVFYAAASGVAHGKKKPASQKTPASMICTAADAVGHEIDLSWGESRRDIVFYAAASEVAHGKNKPASERTPAPAICTAAHAVGHEIDLSWGESRRDMVFYSPANGVAHGKKIAGIPKNTGLYVLYRSGCCRVRNWFAMHQMMSWHNVLCGSQRLSA